MGILARAVHSISQDAFGYLVTRILDPKPDNATYMAAQFEKRLTEFDAAGDPDRLSRNIERRLTRDGDSLPNATDPPCATTISTKATCSSTMRRDIGN